MRAWPAWPAVSGLLCRGGEYVVTAAAAGAEVGFGTAFAEAAFGPRGAEVVVFVEEEDGPAERRIVI